MRPPADPTNGTYPERVVGALILALGASTMLGWLTRHPTLFQFLPGLLPMVFGTGLGFSMCGLALCLVGKETKAAGRVRSALCSAVCVLTLGVLLEVGLDKDLGFDFQTLHSWYDYGNTRPGRMAPNTALALLLISAAVALSNRVRLNRNPFNGRHEAR